MTYNVFSGTLNPTHLTSLLEGPQASDGVDGHDLSICQLVRGFQSGASNVNHFQVHCR